MDREGRPDYRAMCKYGEQCYQTNPMHLEKFRHPEKRKRTEVEHKKDEDHEKENKDIAKASTKEESDESPAKKTRPNEEKNQDEKEEQVDEPKIQVGKEDFTKNDNSEAVACPEYDGDVLPDSPEDARQSIKQKFLVDMPEDFFQFWDYCKEKNHDKPEEALLDATGLRLVGPFDVLSGKLRKHSNRKADDYLAHYRFYYDVPEFQTVLCSDESLFHIGYFRDDPREMPVFLASNDPDLGSKLSPLGDNLFGALHNHISNLIKSADPFKQSKLHKLKESIHVYAKMKIHDQDVSLEIKTQKMKNRDKLKVANTFHGAGLVVPYDKKTQVGYREIPETYASLRKIFKNVIDAETEEAKKKAGDVLHELITNVQFANDEGDPGMGLELGINAFCYGGERLHNCIGHLMTVSYSLLQREEFSRVLKAHLTRRPKEGCFKVK